MPETRTVWRSSALQTSRLSFLTLLPFLLFAITSLSTVASGQTGYTGIFGGGPLYKHVQSNITEIQNSGFNEVIVWSVEVKPNGDLNFNGEFPLTSNGVYIGNQTFPNFVSDLAAMKQGTVKRITFSIGSSNLGDWQDITDLVNSQGTGPDSILFRDFQALKAAIPSLDAIDFDDENSQDLSSTVAFAVMLGKLGYHVTPDAFNNSSYWTSVVSEVNNQLPGTIDGVHLQAYAGGQGNSPCSGWNFGNVPVFPGLWDRNDTPSEVQLQMNDWHAQCGILGGFLWLYDDIVGENEASQYASVINTAVGKTPDGGTPTGVGTPVNLASAYNRTGIYTAGSMYSPTGGLDGGGFAYSASELVSSPIWNNTIFTLGNANSPNDVSANGQAVTLPSGNFSAVSLLATGVDGNQTQQVFTVKYADGTTTAFTQSLSDWTTPQNFPGESIAVGMHIRTTAFGSSQFLSSLNLYGYSYTLDNSKAVSSITLPENPNVEVLAITLIP
jgi:hypothetical protein